MLADKVLSFIREHHIVAEGELVVAGVSGGADSLCLIHLLLRIRDALGIRLHLAHLDHALRPESSSDARYVAELASAWGLPYTLERQDVGRYRARYRLSVEEAARHVRYAFFARLCRDLGAAGVAVGHTADDQVETILLHWVRGTGLGGLRGMQPVTRLAVPPLGERVTVLRPLLELRRSETEEYCANAGIQPREDASNRSMRYRRNRIRYRLLPALKSYNPNIQDTLLRMARVIDRDYTFIDEQVRRVWPEVATESASAVTLDNGRALALPPAILFHLLRMAVERVAGSLVGLEVVHLEEMAEFLRKPAGTTLTLPHGLVMDIGYGYCTISLGHAPAPLPTIPQEATLAIPGETVLPGWKVRARVQEDGPWQMEEDPWTAILDLDKLGDRLYVRARHSGDRFRPLGMAHEKRLQDFFVDAKIPRSWRDRVPLVVTPAQIAWVVGWRIDDRVKVTQRTRRALFLRFTLIPESAGRTAL